jgi:hypothetical protein
VLDELSSPLLPYAVPTYQGGKADAGYMTAALELAAAAAALGERAELFLVPRLVCVADALASGCALIDHDMQLMRASPTAKQLLLSQVQQMAATEQDLVQQGPSLPCPDLNPGMPLQRGGQCNALNLLPRYYEGRLTAAELQQARVPQLIMALASSRQKEEGITDPTQRTTFAKQAAELVASRASQLTREIGKVLELQPPAQRSAGVAPFVQEAQQLLDMMQPCMWWWPG